MKTALVGITGGIGAGKSALARVFSAAGYPVISADDLAREVVAVGSPALKEIASTFGASALNPDGSLNRGWVRSTIATNPALRISLERITHPAIQALSTQRIKEHFQHGARIVFYEAPLLFEAKSDQKMDAVICVHASDDLRIARASKRDGRSENEIRSLLTSQMPQRDKMKRSDYLISNEGSEAELESRALALLKKIETSLDS